MHEMLPAVNLGTLEAVGLWGFEVLLAGSGFL